MPLHQDCLQALSSLGWKYFHLQLRYTSKQVQIQFCACTCMCSDFSAHGSITQENGKSLLSVRLPSSQIMHTRRYYSHFKENIWNFRVKCGLVDGFQTPQHTTTLK